MKINVGVMFGGESVEHEVSIISAMQAIEALDKEKYNVFPIYISKTSDFYYSEKMFDVEFFQDLENAKKESSQVTFYKENDKAYMQAIKKKLFKNEKWNLDVMIPIMHGTNGEDGVIQGYLEMLNIPYSGSNTAASAVGQDKVLMKNVFSENNIPIVDWFWFYSFDFEDKEKWLNKAEEIGYPLVIKPANLGSSIGISIVENKEEFIEGSLLASEYDEKIVVEKAIKNLREVNCSALGDVYNLQTSIIEEVNMGKEILTFDDKYLKDGKKTGSKSSGMASAARQVPANLSEELESKIHYLSKEVVRAINSSGVCRIDFLIDEEENVFVNEINSMPGSLAFYLWKDKGISFTTIMDNLIKTAVDRKRRQEKMIYTYDSNILKNFSNNGAKGVKK